MSADAEEPRVYNDPGPSNASKHGASGNFISRSGLGFRARLGKSKLGPKTSSAPQPLGASSSQQDLSSHAEEPVGPPVTAKDARVTSSAPTIPPLTVLERLHALLPIPGSAPGSAPEVPHIQIPTPPSPTSPAPPEPRALKIKIVSWNMHDSIPGGDLEQLLGPIPSYTPSALETSVSGSNIPDLGPGDGHPYHLVVVAGQECPSVSGLPMALGAGLRIGHQKDKERPKHKRRSDSISKTSIHGPNGSPKKQTRLLPFDDSNLDLSDDHRRGSLDDYTPSQNYNPSLASLVDSAYNQGLHAHPGGWSSVLEDWLVYGKKNPRKPSRASVSQQPSRKGTRDSAPPTSFVNPSNSNGSTVPDIPVSTSLPNPDVFSSSSPPNIGSLAPAFVNPNLSRALSDGHIRPHHQDSGSFSPQPNINLLGILNSSESAQPPPPVLKRSQTFTTTDASTTPSDTTVAGAGSVNYVGPYELAVKERMMGIYLAVYVHRDVKALIRGTDHGCVTAGLIGGRVGNKGGVGVSLNVDGTTFLFINAHLAAHQDRTQVRMDNLAKIKAELDLNSFLSPGDERDVAEEITDRFDHSFVFGDLNFRIDLARQEADALIQAQDYAKALESDQLRLLMTNGEFPGFAEAPINFPPTFKYDVASTYSRADGQRVGRRKTVKRAIRKLKKQAVMRDWHEWRHGNGPLPEGDEEDDCEDVEEERGDDHSFVSSASGLAGASSASMHSGTEAEDDSSSSSDDDDDEGAPSTSEAIARANTLKNASSPPVNAQAQLEQIGMAVSNTVNTISEHPAAKKAKSTWKSFLQVAKKGVTSTSSSSSPSPPRSAALGRSKSRTEYEAKLDQSRRKHSSVPASMTISSNGSGPSLAPPMSASLTNLTDSPPSLSPPIRPDTPKTPPILQPTHPQFLPSIAINTPTDTTPSGSAIHLPSTQAGSSQYPTPSSNTKAPNQFLEPKTSPSRRPPLSRLSTPETSSDAPPSPKSPSAHERSGRRHSHKAEKKGSVDEEREGDGPITKPGIYDTSSKQRVPSWCDRILYKSTVKPPDDTDTDSDSEHIETGGRRRGGVRHLLEMWFHRPRSDSIPSTTSGTATPLTEDAKPETLFPRTISLPTPTESVTPTSLLRRNNSGTGTAGLSPGADLRRSPSEPRRKPRFGKILARSATRPEEASSTGVDEGDEALPRSSRSFSLPHVSVVPPSSSDGGHGGGGILSEGSSASALERPRSSSDSSVRQHGAMARKGNGTENGGINGSATGATGVKETSISVPRHAFLSPTANNQAESEPPSSLTTTTATTPHSIISPRLRNTPSRRWFPNILPRVGSQPHVQPPPTDTPAEETRSKKQKVKRRRKGDVECLAYGTLDDESMARLRGKSDHRPIVGVYSICVE